MEAKEVFKNHPNLQHYYECSDKTKFYSKNHAENHARILKDRTIQIIEKTSVEKLEQEVVESIVKELSNEKKATEAPVVKQAGKKPTSKK